MSRQIQGLLYKYHIVWNFNSGYGIVSNYEVNAYLDDASGTFLIVISSFLPEVDKDYFVSRVNTLHLPKLQAGKNEFGVTLSLHLSLFGINQKNFDQLFDKPFTILKEMNAPGVDTCPLTGKAITEISCSNFYFPVTGFKIRIDLEGKELANSVASKIASLDKKAPNNYLLGTLGVLIGAIVGVGLTVLFTVINYYPVLTGMSTLLGLFLYIKFKGKQNWTMIIISSIISFIFVMGSVLGSYIYSSGIAAIEAGKDLNAFDAFRIIMSRPNVARNKMILFIVVNFIEILLSEYVFISRILYRKRQDKRTNKNKY